MPRCVFAPCRSLHEASRKKKPYQELTQYVVGTTALVECHYTLLFTLTRCLPGVGSQQNLAAVTGIAYCMPA